MSSRIKIEKTDKGYDFRLDGIVRHKVTGFKFLTYGMTTPYSSDLWPIKEQVAGLLGDPGKMLALEFWRFNNRQIFLFFNDENVEFVLNDISLEDLEVVETGQGSPACVAVKGKHGTEILSGSGYRSGLLMGDQKKFFLDGSLVLTMKFWKKREVFDAEQQRMAQALAQHAQYHHPQNTIYSSSVAPGFANQAQAPMNWVLKKDLDLCFEPNENLFFVKEGRPVLSKNVDSISFFGQHCIVTRLGLTNVYSIQDGFKSPVWFSSYHGVDSAGRERSISKKVERVFLVIGKKYVWIERNSPFSLFNSGVFK
jgi:hypothetical protein